MRTLVFSWGRMNPPTVGHEKVVEKVKSLAQKYNGQGAVFLTKTHDNQKNPLTYEDKLYYAQRAFGDIVRDIETNDIVEVFRKVAKNYDRMILVVGADRVSEFKSLLNRYRDEFGFASYGVVSAGDRDPDSDGVEGISGTKMRNAAVLGDFKTFSSGLPKTLSKDAKEIFNKIKQTINTLEEFTNIEVPMKSFLSELKNNQPNKTKKVFNLFGENKELDDEIKSLQESIMKSTNKRARKLMKENELGAPMPMDAFTGKGTPLDIVSNAISDVISRPLNQIVDNPESLKDILMSRIEVIFGSSDQMRDAWRVWTRLNNQQKEQAFNIAVDRHSAPTEPVDDLPMDMDGDREERLPPVREAADLTKTRRIVKEAKDEPVEPHECVIDLITKVSDMKLKNKENRKVVNALSEIHVELVKIAKSLRGSQ